MHKNTLSEDLNFGLEILLRKNAKTTKKNEAKKINKEKNTA